LENRLQASRGVLVSDEAPQVANGHEVVRPVDHAQLFRQTGAIKARGAVLSRHEGQRFEELLGVAVSRASKAVLRVSNSMRSSGE
jgi:hypothetical protein